MPNLYDVCMKKRSWTKSDVWDTNVALTTASRDLRAHADQELKLHGISFCKCAVCGSYSENGLIDTGHIMSSSSFDDDVPLGVINHIGNLLPMCKTCHRKFDSNRHDKAWSDHRIRVLNAIKKQLQLVVYIGGSNPHTSPVDLVRQFVLAKDPTHYDFFFEVNTPLVIKNTGERYMMNDEELYYTRMLTMGDLISPSNCNGMSYYSHREHAKGEAFKHGMYDDVRCLVCNEGMVCDLAHAHRLCDIPRDIPMGIVNHPHNLLWLCPNHNHLLDNPPSGEITDQYRREYDGFIRLLNEKLILHRAKYPQIPIRGKSYLFNTVGLSNWQETAHA